jgi:hypothetical protein
MTHPPTYSECCSLTYSMRTSTYVLQQFKDTDAGMEANMRIWYPAGCPPIYLEEHAEHYTIEFRNGCRLAAATLARQRQPQQAS